MNEIRFAAAPRWFRFSSESDGKVTVSGWAPEGVSALLHKRELEEIAGKIGVTVEELATVSGCRKQKTGDWYVCPLFRTNGDEMIVNVAIVRALGFQFGGGTWLKQLPQ